MTYRDERDALRERVETLQEDLNEAERKIAEQKANEEKQARVEVIEQRMNEARRELDGLANELERLKGAPQRPQKSNSVYVVLAASGALALAGIGAGFFLALRSAPEREMPPEPAPQKPAEVVATVPPLPPEPAPTVAPVPVPEATPPAPARTAEVSFKGRVAQSTGMGPRAGSACTLLALLEGNGGEKGRVRSLEVQCGGQKVYDSRDKLEGMSMFSAGFAELAGKQAGTFTYAIRYSDTGSRSGPRTQISIDTTKRAGSVWSEVVPNFRLDLTINEESAPVKGEALLAPKTQ